MAVFKHYARYYDLLYKDKDYSAEVKYVVNKIQNFCPKAKKILDLGCGTGKHAALLAEVGFEVTGIDQSRDMIALAEKRKENLPKEVANRLRSGYLLGRLPPRSIYYFPFLKGSIDNGRQILLVSS